MVQAPNPLVVFYAFYMQIGRCQTQTKIEILIFNSIDHFCDDILFNCSYTILFRCLILSFSVTLIAIPIILLVVNSLVLIGIQISFLAGCKTLKSYTNSKGCINHLRGALKSISGNINL